MKKHIVRSLTAVALAAIATIPAHAADKTSADTKVSLNMDNFAAIEATSAVSLTPTQADFEADQVTAAQAIQIKMLTNDIKGCTVSVRNSKDASIKQGDLQIKGNGDGIVNFDKFNAPAPDGAELYKSDSSDGEAVARTLDVRVVNLRKYPGGDNGSGSKAVYTDTLTFTILPN